MFRAALILLSGSLGFFFELFIAFVGGLFVVNRIRFFFVDRPPGDYTASASTEVTRSAMFHLSAGETKYITTALTRGILIGHVLPVLEYPEQGQSEVRQSRYIGPPLAGSM